MLNRKNILSEFKFSKIGSYSTPGFERDTDSLWAIRSNFISVLVAKFHLCPNTAFLRCLLYGNVFYGRVNATMLQAAFSLSAKKHVQKQKEPMRNICIIFCENWQNKANISWHRIIQQDSLLDTMPIPHSFPFDG